MTKVGLFKDSTNCEDTELVYSIDSIKVDAVNSVRVMEPEERKNKQQHGTFSSDEI